MSENYENPGITESGFVFQSTTPDVAEIAKGAINDLLPTKSKDKYEQEYEKFVKYKKQVRTTSSSESIVISYFTEMKKKYKPSSLWNFFSMLKKTLIIKEKIDIGQYMALNALLSKNSKGLQPKKAKVFTVAEMNKFLQEAPDVQYLLHKVILIFGLYGALRKCEFLNVKVTDVSSEGNLLLVKIPETKTYESKAFVITEDNSIIVRKYMALRPSKAKSDRFFLRYQKRSCTCQVIGIHKFESIPKEIALHLNLEIIEEYTTHAFRRTSATVLADAGGENLELRRHGRWKSDTFVQGYIDESVEKKAATAEKISSFMSKTRPKGNSTMKNQNLPEKLPFATTSDGANETDETKKTDYKNPVPAGQKLSALIEGRAIFHNCTFNFS